MAPSRSQRRKLFILSSIADGISANKVIKNGVVKGVNVEEAASLGKISREVLKKTLPLLRIMFSFRAIAPPTPCTGPAHVPLHCISSKTHP